MVKVLAAFNTATGICGQHVSTDLHDYNAKPPTGFRGE
jgi:hypothetical protein